MGQRKDEAGVPGSNSSPEVDDVGWKDHVPLMVDPYCRSGFGRNLITTRIRIPHPCLIRKSVLGIDPYSATHNNIVDGGKFGEGLCRNTTRC